MQKCEEFQALISALLDEEITEAERSALMEHLAQCDDCKARLSDQLAMRDALRSMTAEAPAGFAESVMARVHETAQETAKSEKKILAFPAIRRWAGLAACCAVVLLGVFALGGLPHTMEDAVNSAAMAPDMRDGGAGVPEAYSTGSADADAAVPEYGMADAARAEVPESPATDDAACEAADYAVMLTCGSDTAKQWVKDNLQKDWVAGTLYFLTEEQYTELSDLLAQENAPFTTEIGTEGSDIYILLAE